MAVALVAMTFGAAELTGYRFLDTENGNLMDNIDTSFRYLSEDEIAYARQFFGDTIDYSEVKVFNRRHFHYGLPTSQNSVATSFFGNIHLYAENMRDQDLTSSTNLKATLIHELTHVWQYQNYGIVTHFNNAVPVLFGGSEKYDYEIDVSVSFHDYKYEQQAEIMEDLVYERENSKNYKSKTEKDLETIISTVFPLGTDTEVEVEVEVEAESDIDIAMQKIATPKIQI